jgi:perosamine synthetase
VHKFIHDDIGFNYRLPNISAAIGLAQLEGIDKVFQEKERIYNRYKNNLKGTKGIVIPKVENWAKYIMWVFNLSVDKNYPLSRDELVIKLKEKNIETRNAFVPISYQDFLIKKYNLFDKNECPNANIIMDNGLYLPSGNIIPNDDIDFICQEIIKLGKK